MTYDEAKDWIFENIPDYVPPKPKVGDFSKFVMPIIKNLGHPGLLNEIMAVQPMSGPNPFPMPQ